MLLPVFNCFFGKLGRFMDKTCMSGRIALYTMQYRQCKTPTAASRGQSASNTVHHSFDVVMAPSNSFVVSKVSTTQNSHLQWKMLPGTGNDMYIPNESMRMLNAAQHARALNDYPGMLRSGDLCNIRGKPGLRHSQSRHNRHLSCIFKFASCLCVRLAIVSVFCFVARLLRVQVRMNSLRMLFRSVDPV